MIIQEDIFSALAKNSNIQDLSPNQITDEAIEAADRGASMEWKAEALRLLREICQDHVLVTVEMLSEALSHSGVSTSNNSALGSIMRKGAALGLMRKTGQFKTSDDPKKHMRVIPIWESLLRHL